FHVDVRGFGKSEGEIGSIRKWNEAEVLDYYDTIEWAGKQAWSNGNVGLHGVSYLAIAQYYAASLNPPHLKAINPWEGVSDQYRDTCFPGGIPEVNFHVGWEVRYLNRKFDETTLAATLDSVVNQSMLKTAPQLDKINVPALICATWSDQGLHCRGGFEAFKRISSSHKWLYTHGRRKWEEYYSDEALKYQKQFFDYFLKGTENGMLDTPRVRLEIRETIIDYKVRDENQWPIARTEYKKLYLDSKTGSLTINEVNPARKISYDSTSERIEFDFKFDEDTELSGHMKLRLWVSAEDADDMDLFVGVEKLDADGKEVYFNGMNGYLKGIVTRGWMRVSQRELDLKESTPWQPFLKHQGEQKMKPHEIVDVEIEILPSSTIFRKGEILKLTVQGRDMITHPQTKYTRLVNNGIHSIYTGGEYDSHLLIPLIP
ncbi:CocE/NonD family hydrolase, partial [Thermodesulfobacteriota bacterium]